MNETVRVTYGQANLMIYQADWTALLTTLSWREVENADRYTIILTDQAQQSALVSVDMSGGQPKITVSGQTPAAESGGWYNVKPGSTVTAATPDRAAASAITAVSCIPCCGRRTA